MPGNRLRAIGILGLQRLGNRFGLAGQVQDQALVANDGDLA